MIREYAPVFLIPAAWILTFLTVNYPGVDPYWIEHMHLFMIFFLGGFAVTSWRQMEGAVMETWRNIIAVGFLVTAFGTSGFFLQEIGNTAFILNILYWISAPAFGFWVTSEESEDFSREYRYLCLLSIVPLSSFAAGALSGNSALLGVSFLSAGVIQSVSIMIASYMDS